jgi:hypothetical protein
VGLARELLLSGNKADAAAQTNAVCATVNRLLRRNPNKPEWRIGLTRCWGLQAQFLLASGAKDLALNAARQALGASKTVHSTDRIADGYLVAGAYRLVGDAEGGLGHRDAARSAWSAAFALLPSGVAEMPDEMSERVTILERLGKNSDSGAVQSRLRRMGYRQTS